jgi:hypothetical protein
MLLAGPPGRSLPEPEMPTKPAHYGPRPRSIPWRAHPTGKDRRGVAASARRHLPGVSRGAPRRPSAESLAGRPHRCCLDGWRNGWLAPGAVSGLQHPQGWPEPDQEGWLMTTCTRCRREMLIAHTCSATGPRVVYGEEGFHAPGTYAPRCPDCGVSLGGVHHVGCTVEVCPCGASQRAWCEHRTIRAPEVHA